MPKLGLQGLIYIANSLKAVRMKVTCESNAFSALEQDALLR